MDPENNNGAAPSGNNADEIVSFPQVAAVATGWMLDFLFVSLCRHFKEDKLDEFNETITVLQAISQSASLKGKDHNEKTMICAFLARVMHGKQLDVLFEEDESVMPLMSAAKIWSTLEHVVADEDLFKNVTILLLVQSVAICLEKGQKSAASSALKWFENNHEFPEKTGVKLWTIVKQRDTYHPFLMSFTFSRLLETVQCFVDAYLEKNPSDDLLKAATKTVQTSQNIEDLEDVVSQNNSLSDTVNKSAKSKKTKRKLLTKMTDLWTPNSSKKPFVCVERLSVNELSQLKSEKSPHTAEVKTSRKTREKWTHQLDKYLKEGVKRHGQGKWSQILLDYDFEGRTGTMLKDRWRVLMRAHEVG
ncbi:telomeric repeat-binding factor 1 [Mugil cephalus]|uniref:telomeric repeat-binding factor 1 n=1 Tax=Mugil cephalus TaxID=48193 RepID=UPI001FB57347|nr:telomeric repeat-binding factor 1 [Mugil cephalus]